MNSSARFRTLSAAIAFTLILLAASPASHSQSSKHDDLSAIVPAVDDLLPDPDGPNKLPEEVIAALLASDNVTLYAVSEAEGTTGPIPDYKVLGKATINKNDTAALIEDLKHSLAEHNGVAMCGLCFHAHHVLRSESGGHIYDLMICYPCSQVLTYGKDSAGARHFISANWINGSPDVIKRIAKSHGLPQSQVFIDEELKAQYAAREYAHWLSMTPQALRPFFSPTLDPSRSTPSPDIRILRAALAQEHPDTKQRILALFSWYGSVPWGGSGDGSAGQLLQDYSYSELWSQAQLDRLTNAQLAGAARFFSGKYVDGSEEDSRRALQEGLRKYSEEKAYWLQLMPTSIRPLWKDAMWQYGEYWHKDAYGRALEEEKPMLEALSHEFPDKKQRILTLFNWFGANARGNLKFGVYETVVDHLLQQFTTPDLAQALQSKPLTEQQLAGAVRLFSQPQFGRARRAEMRRIPSSLKAVLLAHDKYSTENTTLRWLLVQSVPTPGDGVITPDRVEQVLPRPDDEYVDFVTVESTRAEPQFAVLTVPGTPVDDGLLRHSPAEVGPPCINTGNARYLINKFNYLLFEILANCGNLTRGYSYVICRLGGDLRCSDAPQWYFTGRRYRLTNEGLIVDGSAPHPWENPIETQKRLQAMAARIKQNRARSSRSHERWLYCRRLDPPNSTTVFTCSGRDNLAMCKGFPSLDGIRDGDVIDMNSPVGRWVTQQSNDSDSSQWACWTETH